MSFVQWLKDKLDRGEEPTYVVRNVDKPSGRVFGLKLRGLGLAKTRARTKPSARSPRPAASATVNPSL